jgi:uncharacterized RDD family membrane protein YckC
MPEALKRADAFLRIVAKVLDFLLIASVSELLPKAGFLTGVMYILISDSLFEGRSIGKKIIGLQVISLSSKTICSVKESILRNLPFALALLALKIPFIGWLIGGFIGLIELIMIFAGTDGMRAGDMLANTTVVMRSDKEKEKEEVKGFASM